MNWVEMAQDFLGTCMFRTWRKMNYITVNIDYTNYIYSLHTSQEAHQAGA